MNFPQSISKLPNGTTSSTSSSINSIPSSSTSTADLDSLSDEMILKIISYCKLHDIVHLRQTCRRLKSLVDVPRNWEELLRKDFNFHRQSFWRGWSPENIYKAAYKFRHILGAWIGDLHYFGMIVLIRLEQDGIIAYDCSPPLDESILDADGLDDLITMNSDADYENAQRLHRFRYRRLFAVVPQIVYSSSSNSSMQQEEATQSFVLRFVCNQSPSCGEHSAQDERVVIAEEESSSISVDDRPSTSASVSHINGHSKMEVDDDGSAIGCLEMNATGFTFKCAHRTEHGQAEQSYRYWLEFEHGFRLNGAKSTDLDSVLSILRNDKDYELRLEKFEAKTLVDSFRLSQRMDQLVRPNRPSRNSAHVMEPGLYFGHFSWHGWEVLNVFYANDESKLIGEKVTGDQMVPAGRTSFRVDLQRRCHLTLDEQVNMATIRAAVRRNTAVMPPAAASAGSIDDHNPSAINGDTSSTSSSTIVYHPFRVPSDCAMLGARTVPDRCAAFYVGEGQIAFPNFCNPRYLSCLFVIFDRDRMGVLWLDLRCFMPIFRITDFD